MLSRSLAAASLLCALLPAGKAFSAPAAPAADAAAGAAAEENDLARRIDAVSAALGAPGTVPWNVSADRSSGPWGDDDRRRGRQGPWLEAAPVPLPPLFDRALWDSLAPPDPPAVGWLGVRDPGLSAPSVRELAWERLDEILAEAVARGESALDFFTDDGLRGPEIYYVSYGTLLRLDAAYDLRTISKISGDTLGGAPFHLDGLVLGAGRVVLLYDFDRFDYANADYPGYNYTAEGRVVETIQGPGDLAVDGLSLARSFHPRIQRFLKLSPAQVRVETNHGSGLTRLLPIRKRAP